MHTESSTPEYLIHVQVKENPLGDLVRVNATEYGVPEDADVRIFSPGTDLPEMGVGDRYMLSDDVKVKKPTPAPVHPEGVIKILKQLAPGKYLVEVMPD